MTIITIGSMIFMIVCVGIYGLLKFPKSKMTVNKYYLLIGLSTVVSLAFAVFASYAEHILSDSLALQYLANLSCGLSLGFVLGLLYFLPSFYGRKKNKYFLIWLLNSTAGFTGFVTWIVAGVWAGVGDETEK